MPSSILNSDDGVISGTSGLKSSGGDDGVLVFQSKGTETARINTDKQIVAAAGTASLPALTTTGDVNTGIFFPAADTIAFAEGGAEAMRIDSSGNVGIGGTPTSGYKLDIAGSGTQRFSVRDTASTGVARVVANAEDAYFGNESTTGSSIFVTQNAERARLTSAGVLDLTGPLSGVYIKSSGGPTVADGGTVTLSSGVAGGALIIVYNANLGNGGVFWANYSGTVTKLAGDGSTADSGSSDINVYKGAGSHVTTFKNRSGVTRSYYIAVYSADFRL